MVVFRFKSCLFFLLALIVIGGGSVLSCQALAGEGAEAELAQDGADEAKGLTGLPLPRFASLRFAEINMRTGPGTRYPIEWVYVRQGLPVEITAEFDIWRRIRDWEGTEGWVQKSALTGKRTGIVIGGLRDLREAAAPDAPLVAHVEAGAVGKVLACQKAWCELKFGSTKGYLPKSLFWGTYEGEEF